MASEELDLGRRQALAFFHAMIRLRPKLASRDPLPPKIGLITPPSPFLLDERVFVNLGILKVAAVLEDRGVLVEHVDLSGTENFLEAVQDYAAGTDAPVVGITVTTPQLPSVVRIIRELRGCRPDVRIVLGGPHVTLARSAAKLEARTGRVSRAHEAWRRLESMADTLVAGDGELAVFVALGPDAPKVVDADDRTGGLFLSKELYEETPFPARHLVDLDSYHYSIDGHRSTSLIAQLGCPFACGFCGGRNSSSLRVVRTRTSASIVREVRFLYEHYGYTGFMFYDDELNVNKGVLDLMDQLAALQDTLGVEFRLRGFVKAELFTPAQAQAMYRAGFRWLLSGFESGSESILENINKRAGRAENTRAVDVARAAGLKVKALMSVGHPGECERTIRDTQEWLLQVAPEDFDCTVITTYPGTPYYDESVPHASEPGVWTYTCRKSGDRLHAYEVDFFEVADYYKGDPKGGYKAFVFTDHLSASHLVEMRDWVEASVRAKLGIPYSQARPALLYEHSTGQGAHAALPPHILSRSNVTTRTTLADGTTRSQGHQAT